MEYASLPVLEEDKGTIINCLFVVEDCCCVMAEDAESYVPLECAMGRMAREYNDPERHMLEVNETIRMLESVYLSTPPYNRFKAEEEESLEPPFHVHIDKDQKYQNY